MQSLYLNSTLAWGPCRARSRFNLGGEGCPHAAHVSAHEVGGKVPLFLPSATNLWRAKLGTKAFGRATSASKGVMLRSYILPPRDLKNTTSLCPCCKLPKAVMVLVQCQAEVACCASPHSVSTGSVPHYATLSTAMWHLVSSDHGQSECTSAHHVLCEHVLMSATQSYNIRSAPLPISLPCSCGTWRPS